jgi:hypothetical protein
MRDQLIRKAAMGSMREARRAGRIAGEGSDGGEEEEHGGERGEAEVAAQGAESVLEIARKGIQPAGVSVVRTGWFGSAASLTGASLEGQKIGTMERAKVTRGSAKDWETERAPNLGKIDR